MVSRDRVFFATCTVKGTIDACQFVCAARWLVFPLHFL